MDYRTALVVDDDTSYRQIMREILTANEWRVTEAATGEDALMLSEKPDLLVIVIDISLGGGMDGWTFARLARDRWPDVGFLFISGTSQSPQQYDIFGQFIMKPFRLSDFIFTAEQAAHKCPKSNQILN
jgi:CheY-like chemotaxis protein